MKTVTRRVIFRETVALLVVINASFGFGAPAVCTTPACKSRGAELIESINTSVNPCDNFYEFACGGWISRHPVPGYASMHGHFQDLDTRSKYEMSEKLAMSFNPTSTSEELLFKAHTACMLGTADDENKDDEDAWNEIVTSLGVENWPTGPGDMVIPLWSDLLGKIITTFDYGPIIDIGVRPNEAGNNNTIHIKPGGLATNSKHFNNPEYLSYITTVSNILNITSLAGEQLTSAVQQMVDFEKQLSEILRKPSTNQVNLTTVGEFAADQEMRRSQVDVFRVLKNTFEPADKKVYDSDQLWVTDIAKVRKLLMACGEVEKHIVSNVLIWNLVQTVGTEVMPELRVLRDKFKAQLRGKKYTASLPQTLHCNGVLARLSPVAYSAFFNDHVFTSTASIIKTVRDMVTFQKNIFHGELVANEWMDEETRTAAINKLEKIATEVGYAAETRTKDWIEQQIPKIGDVQGERFVHFYVAFAKFTRTNMLKSLRMAPEQPREVFDVTVVNAYYNRKKNKVFIPSGILRRPFFDPDLPGYLNYASLGYIVFHEIAHGFDSNGRHFDENGQLRDWWSAKTAEVFLQKSECFVNQYGNITDPDSHIKLNSKLTLGEDISDNAAARQSYLAFQAMERENARLELLPGMEAYTPAQLHFIMAAQPWCKTYSPESKELVIADDVHSISEYRVNIAMGNTRAFSNVFKCPPGSKMNTANKCKVW